MRLIAFCIGLIVGAIGAVFGLAKLSLPETIEDW